MGCKTGRMKVLMMMMWKLLLALQPLKSRTTSLSRRELIKTLMKARKMRLKRKLTKNPGA